MTARAFACPICGAVLYAQTDTTENPEAPELVRFDAKPWIGIVEPSLVPPGTPSATLLVLCSSQCKNTFFKVGG